MSILTPIKEQKSKVHFSEYIVTPPSRADESKPAEVTEKPETAKPAEPATS